MIKKSITAVLLLLVLVVLFFTFSEKTPELSQECGGIFSYEIGQKQTYMFSSRNKMRLFTQNHLRTMDTQMDGILNVRFMRHEENTTITLMQLSNLSIELGDSSLENILKHLYTQLFIVRLSADGHIINYYFKGDNKDSLGLEQFISEFQIVVKNMLRYTEQETTPEGIVRTNYERNSTNFCSIKKQRHGFYMKNQKSHMMNIIRSEVNASVDTNWIKTFHSHETIEVISNKKKIAEYFKYTTLQNSNLPIDNSLEIWLFDGDIDNLIARFQNSSQESYMKIASNKAEKAYIKKNAITLATLLFGMQGIDSQQIRKIAQYLMLFPDEAQKLLPVIKSADSDTAAALIYVLKRAGTPQAQLTLQNIIQDKGFEQNNHIRAIIALGGVDKPTSGTVNFLCKTYEHRDTVEEKQLSDAALLNVGRLGENSSYSNKIRDKLIETYQEVPDNSYEKRIVLLSMQNAGAKNFETEIFYALENDNPDVKSAAVAALSKQNRDQVRDHLASLFNTSENLDVRKQLAKTLLTIDTNDQLMSLARENILKDDDDLVRKNLIAYLLKYKERYPENIDTLKQLRKIERDRDNQILLIKNGF